jgi:hypothetical protein
MKWIGPMRLTSTTLRLAQVSKDVFGNVVVHLRGPNQFIPIHARLVDESS